MATLSTVELVQTREIVSTLLEQLGLEAYLFEVEPREDSWQVHVECATAKREWQSIAIPVDRQRLNASVHDDSQRRVLLDEWAGLLCACKCRLRRRR